MGKLNNANPILEAALSEDSAVPAVLVVASEATSLITIIDAIKGINKRARFLKDELYRLNNISSALTDEIFRRGEALENEQRI